MKEGITKERAEILFSGYSKYVYRVALFLTGSSTLADDITQETFLRVFRKYDTYDASKSIEPWLYQITLNVTRNLLRKQRWFGSVDDIPEIGSRELVEDSILQSEEEKELWKAVNNLTLKSKEMIVLHYYSGMKLNEIAEN